MNDFYRLLLGVLCTWRVTHLFQAEDGPWDAIVYVRRVAGDSFFGKLLDCFYCLSLWVSAPLAWVIERRVIECCYGWLFRGERFCWCDARAAGLRKLSTKKIRRSKDSPQRRRDTEKTRATKFESTEWTESTEKKTKFALGDIGGGRYGMLRTGAGGRIW